MNRPVAIAMAILLGASSGTGFGQVRFVDDDAGPGGDGLDWATAYAYLQDALAEASEPANGITEIRIAQGTYLPDRNEAAPDPPSASNCCNFHSPGGCDDPVCEAMVCGMDPSCCGNIWGHDCVALAVAICPGLVCPDRVATFQLLDGVTLVGGFAGIGAVDPDVRNVALFQSVLSGDLLGNDDPDTFPFGASLRENSEHVVTAAGPGSVTVLDGVVIASGRRSDFGSSGGRGTAIRAVGGSLTLTACVFRMNHNDSVYTEEGTTLVTNNTFIDSTIYSVDSDVTITDSVFHGSVRDSATTRAIRNEGTNAVVTGCLVTGHSRGMENSAGSHAEVSDCVFSENDQGIQNFTSSNPTIVRCDFIDNVAVDHHGAAAAGMGNSSGSSPTVIDCNFVGNIVTASFGSFGGAMVNGTGSPTIINCTFLGNAAGGPGGGQGGAVYNGDGTPTFVNCLFADNFVSGFTDTGVAGAMYNAGGDPTMINCTFTDNMTTFDSVVGGIFNEDGTPAFFNCIVWGNTDGQIEGIPVTVAHSVVEGGYAGVGNIDADPMFIDPGNGDYRLAAGSPCIDAGNSTAVPLGVLTDLAGEPRFVDDPETQDTGVSTCLPVDMGPYEFSLGIQDCCPWDLDGDGFVGITDFLDLLAAWDTDPGGPPDFDGNGNVGIEDFLELLSNWGQCLDFSDCNNNGVNDTIDIIEGTSLDCNGNTSPDECDIGNGLSDDCNGNLVPDECELVDCNINNILDACDILDGTSEDCNGNGIPDECDDDCNDNDVPDDCDIAEGTSEDCDDNGIPDECEDDCNDNGIGDLCDVADGTSIDCNFNGIPDECEDDCNENGIDDACDIAAGTSEDCDGNGVPDECDPDCNNNDVPDGCDILAGTSEDCDDNGVPDECEEDCNGNGVVDSCDIADGTSSDVNFNGVPDECEVIPINDLCDDALPIIEGMYPFTTIGAGTDGLAFQCVTGDNDFVFDIWYVYTPVCTGAATFSLCNAADFDTRLAVYFADAAECPPPPGAPLACSNNAPGCGQTSEMSLVVVEGINYLVRVGGETSVGDGTLTVSCVPQQPAE